MSSQLQSTSCKSRKAQRMSPRSKKDMVNDVKRAIRWNIQAFEQATTSVTTVPRSLAITMLKLHRISPKADPTGRHTMQMLIAQGYVQASRSVMGCEYFDRDQLLQGLYAFCKQ